MSSIMLTGKKVGLQSAPQTDAQAWPQASIRTTALLRLRAPASAMRSCVADFAALGKPIRHPWIPVVHPTAEVLQEQ